MTTFHIGCAGFVKPRDRYLTRLSYVEFDLRAPTPSPKVLATWKKNRPDNFSYGVVAPVSLYGDPSWPLREPDKLVSELDRLANQVDALGARVLLLRTPMAVSPGSVALKRFTAVFERARKIAPLAVWEPAGLWEREDAVAHAAQFGVVVACDPLHDEVEGPVAYARMRGLGNDHRYHAGRLEEIAQALAGCDEAWVVFESQSAWRESLGFVGISRGVGAEAMLEGEDDEEGADEDDDEDDDGEEGDDEDEG